MTGARRESAVRRAALAVRRAVGPVRVRATIVAVAVVAVALTIGAAGLLGLLRRSLEGARDDFAEGRAEDLAARTADGGLTAELLVAGDRFAVAQVVDGDGRVLAYSNESIADTPIATFSTGADHEAERTLDRLAVGPAGRHRVVAVDVPGTEGPTVVYVAVSLEPVGRTVKLFAVALAAGSLVVVALVGLTTWWAMGRALRPIGGISREVEAISAGGLDRRVPAPGTFDEIDGLAATMNAMLGRLDAAADRQRRFSADASHELRSPLAAMRIQLEVALAQPDTADWVTTGSDVLADHGRVERLAQDLLVLARLDAGPEHRAFERVDLGDIADEEIGRRPTIPALALDASGISGCGVLGDRAQLARMVRNLLDNAERHARHRVEVTVAHETDSVVLRVSNDGPGIPPADRDRIFERFTRLDDARASDDGGNGLGLAIVHEIVLTHDGSVVVADRLGGGTCFEVRLDAVR